MINTEAAENDAKEDAKEDTKEDTKDDEQEVSTETEQIEQKTEESSNVVKEEQPVPEADTSIEDKKEQIEPDIKEVLDTTETTEEETSVEPSDLEEKPKKDAKPKKTKEKKPQDKKLLFDKYDLTEVEIVDSGLIRYINLEPIVLPHVSARYANKKFGKSKMNIVERLINNMMRTEKYTGKKFKAYNVVKKSLDIVAKRTTQNPVQVLIQALENGAPKEEIVRLRFGGILVPKSVDTSPSRRLDISIRNICKGALKTSHKNRKDIAVCLAEEMILASKNDMNSFAINKKEDIERVAASAR